MIKDVDDQLIIKSKYRYMIIYDDPHLWGTCNRQIRLGEISDVDHGDHHGINDHMMITPCGELATCRFICVRGDVVVMGVSFDHQHVII